MSKLTLDLHSIYNRSSSIESVLKYSEVGVGRNTLRLRAMALRSRWFVNSPG